jgi:hypothetical protein
MDSWDSELLSWLLDLGWGPIVIGILEPESSVPKHGAAEGILHTKATL